MAKFPYRFDLWTVDGEAVSDMTLELLRDWLKVNTKGFRIGRTRTRKGWFIDTDVPPRRVFFRRETDALHFKMRWSNDLEKPKAVFSTTPRRLSAKWTIEIEPDVEVQMGIDVEQELINALIAEIERTKP